MRAADRAVYAAWTPDGGWDMGWKGVWLWSMSVVLAWQQDKAFLTSTVPGLLRSETPPPLSIFLSHSLCLSLSAHRGKRTIHKDKHNGHLSQSCMSVFLKSYLNFDSTVINEILTPLLHSHVLEKLSYFLVFLSCFSLKIFILKIRLLFSVILYYIIY